MRLFNTFCYQVFCFVISLLTICGNVSYAQTNWEPENFYGIPEKDKQVAFWDLFEDNRYKWDLGSLYLSERIEDGDYYCASITSHTYTKRRLVPMNQSGNYEIEVVMRYVKGSDESMTGLTFGRDVRGSEYNFFFSPRGNFRVTKYDRGRTTDLKSWTPCKVLNKYSYNSLMVRKVADQWYFFVNHQLVEQMAARPFFGNEFGFTIGGHMAVEVDNLRISEIRNIDNMGPQITLLQPGISADGKGRFTERHQIIKGKVYDVSGPVSLMINGQPITVSSQGIFTASLHLPDGTTDISIEAKDVFENVSTKDFSMEFMPDQPLAYSYSPQTQTSSGRNVSAPAYGAQKKGKNYILLIGVNSYQNWTPLHNAVKDCKDIAGTLTSYYQFEDDNVITLFNEEASRENILETFESLQEMLTEHDNLLIYYAGHGYYDETSELGYWVPVNARLNKIPDFIRNSTIHDYLRTINTKHTFLIADACYAGSLFASYRGNSLNENAKSRWAFTSGDIEKVWDGQPGHNSPFARYLIRYLRSNTERTLQAQDLIEAVSVAVERNTAQTPQGSSLRRAGDEGGVFVFHRK